MIRVGFGYDVHRFSSEGDHIKLGGVVVPCFAGIESHSDGDVLVHAVMDALLGAAALGDIGQHFPNTPEFKGISSMELLSRVLKMIQDAPYKIHNIDCSILAQKPILAPYYEFMRKNLAHAMGLLLNQINIKATTPEKLGAFGRTEGLAVHVVALISDEEGAAA
jgi:2-C-methyl-D-erythritol 2,4-cyclodiphosphate synthase